MHHVVCVWQSSAWILVEKWVSSVHQALFLRTKLHAQSIAILKKRFPEFRWDSTSTTDAERSGSNWGRYPKNNWENSGYGLGWKEIRRRRNSREPIVSISEDHLVSEGYLQDECQVWTILTTKIFLWQLRNSVCRCPASITVDDRRIDHSTPKTMRRRSSKFFWANRRWKGSKWVYQTIDI